MNVPPSPPPPQNTIKTQQRIGGMREVKERQERNNDLPRRSESFRSRNKARDHFLPSIIKGERR